MTASSEPTMPPRYTLQHWYTGEYTWRAQRYREILQRNNLRALLYPSPSPLDLIQLKENEVPNKVAVETKPPLPKEVQDVIAAARELSGRHSRGLNSYLQEEELAEALRALDATIYPKLDDYWAVQLPNRSSVYFSHGEEPPSRSGPHKTYRVTFVEVDNEDEDED